MWGVCQTEITEGNLGVHTKSSRDTFWYETLWYIIFLILHSMIWHLDDRHLLKAKFMKRHFVIWEILSFWFEKVMMYKLFLKWNLMIWSLHEAFWREILRYETFWFETWFKLKLYHVKPNGMTLHNMTNCGLKFHAVKYYFMIGRVIYNIKKWNFMIWHFIFIYVIWNFSKNTVSCETWWPGIRWYDTLSVKKIGHFAMYVSFLLWDLWCEPLRYETSWYDTNMKCDDMTLFDMNLYAAWNPVMWDVEYRNWSNKSMIWILRCDRKLYWYHKLTRN